MKQNLLLIFLIPFFSISQTQIGGDIDGETASDESGYSMSLSSNGNIVAIGARYNNGSGLSSGHVRAYENISGVWAQIGNDIDGEAAYDLSGSSVSLSSDGSIIAIGAIQNNDNGGHSGHVRVYEYKSNAWTQIGSDIDGEAVLDRSGWSVSLSSNGNIIAIAAQGNDGNGNNSGHVKVYEYKSNVWTQIGGNIDGEATNDKSGECVSLSSDGSILAISTPFNGGNGENSGHVRVYKYTSGAWTQMGSDIDGEAAGDYSGYSVSLSADGSIIAIGAEANNGNGIGIGAGHVRVYKYTSGVWIQVGSDIDGKAAKDYLGFSVSLSADGSVVAIGAIGDVTDSGLVRIYKHTSGDWTQIGNDIDGEAANDKFGNKVSLSFDGSVVAISAFYNDGNGSNSGHVRIYDLKSILASDTFVLSQFSMSPNPANNQTTIKLNKGLTLEKISIYNSLGQFIQSTQKEIIDTSTLSTGLYYVQIVTDKGKATKKLVIE